MKYWIVPAGPFLSGLTARLPNSEELYIRCIDFNGPDFRKEETTGQQRKVQEYDGPQGSRDLHSAGSPRTRVSVRRPRQVPTARGRRGVHVQGLSLIHI